MNKLKITKNSLENAILLDGQLVFGSVLGNDSSIISSGEGSFAHGYVSDGFIIADASGAHAEGYASDGSILATGLGAHAEGYNTKATGTASHAEGSGTTASGAYSHAEGTYTRASGYGAHAEGFMSSSGNNRIIDASGDGSHAEGFIYAAGGGTAKIIATNQGSHAEGYARDGEIQSTGKGSHAEGYNTKALNNYSHAEGDHTIANGVGAHAEGGCINNNFIKSLYGSYTWYRNNNYIIINANNAESFMKEDTHYYCTIKLGNNDTIYIVNSYNYIYGDDQIIVQLNLNKLISDSTGTGYIWYILNGAIGDYSHTEGYTNTAYGYASHAEGESTYAQGMHSHTEGGESKVMDSLVYYEETKEDYLYYSGNNNQITVEFNDDSYDLTKSLIKVNDNKYILVTRTYHDEMADNLLHIELNENLNESDLNWIHNMVFQAIIVAHKRTISNNCAHAEGYKTIANASCAHAEGQLTIASGIASHAEGIYTQSLGDYSHAEGQLTIASGIASHAEGIGTIADQKAMTAIGKYNVSTGNENTLFVVGCGNIDNNERYERNLLLAEYWEIPNGLYINRYNKVTIGDFYINCICAENLRHEYTCEISPKHKRSSININANRYINLNSSLSIDLDANTNINGSLNVSNDVTCNTLHVSTNKLIISTNGNVDSSGNIVACAFYQTSDIRKKNIKHELDLEKCYELIDKCSEIVFEWKDKESNKEEIGMIAQEVQEFFPEIINEDENGYLSLDYSKLTVICLRVLKDLINEVKILKNLK